MKVTKKLLRGSLIKLLTEGAKENAIKKFGKNIGYVDIDHSGKETFRAANPGEIEKLLEDFIKTLSRLNLSNKQHLFIPLVLKLLTANNTVQFKINKGANLLMDLNLAFTCCIRNNNKMHWGTISKLNTVEEFYKYVSGITRIESGDLCEPVKSGGAHNRPTYFPKSFDPKDAFLFNKLDNKFRKKRDAVFIYDKNELLAIRVNNVDASCYYGQHGKWCIARPKNGMFEQYERGGCHFLIVKSFTVKSKTQNVVFQFNKDKKILECIWDISDRRHDFNLNIEGILNDYDRTYKLVDFLFMRLNVSRPTILEMLFESFKYFLTYVYKDTTQPSIKANFEKLKNISIDDYSSKMLKSYAEKALNDSIKDIDGTMAKYLKESPELDDNIEEIISNLNFYEKNQGNDYLHNKLLEYPNVKKIVTFSDVTSLNISGGHKNVIEKNSLLGLLPSEAVDLYNEISKSGEKANKRSLINFYFKNIYENVAETIKKLDSKNMLVSFVDEFNAYAIAIKDSFYFKTDDMSVPREKMIITVKNIYSSLFKTNDIDIIADGMFELRRIFTAIIREVYQIERKISDIFEKIKKYSPPSQVYFDFISSEENQNKILNLLNSFNESITNVFDENFENLSSEFASLKKSKNIKRTLKFSPNIENVNLDFEISLNRDVSKAHDLFEEDVIKENFIKALQDKYKDTSRYSYYEDHYSLKNSPFKSEYMAIRNYLDENNFDFATFRAFSSLASIYHFAGSDYFIETFNSVKSEFINAFSIDLNFKLDIINFVITIPNSNSVNEFHDILVGELNDYDDVINEYGFSDDQMGELTVNFLDNYTPHYTYFFLTLGKALGFIDTECYYIEDIQPEKLPLHINSTIQNTPGIDEDEYEVPVFTQPMAKIIANIILEKIDSVIGIKDGYDLVAMQGIDSLEELSEITSHAIEMIKDEGIVIDVGKNLDTNDDIFKINHINNHNAVIDNMALNQEKINLATIEIKDDLINELINNLATEFLLFLNRGIISNINNFDQIFEMLKEEALPSPSEYNGWAAEVLQDAIEYI